MTRARWVQYVPLAGMGGAVVSAIALLVGVQWHQSLLLGIVVWAILPFSLVTGLDRGGSLASERKVNFRAHRTRYSSSDEIVDYRTDSGVMRRLRVVAKARLADVGVDLDDPQQASRAKELLGGLAYQAFTAAGPHRLRQNQVFQCFEAVDRLADLRTKKVDNATGAS